MLPVEVTISMELYVLVSASNRNEPVAVLPSVKVTPESDHKSGEAPAAAANPKLKAIPVKSRTS
jgi:hypothetical protein